MESKEDRTDVESPKSGSRESGADVRVRIDAGKRGGGDGAAPRKPEVPPGGDRLAGPDLNLRELLAKRGRGSVALKRLKERLIHLLFLSNGVLVILVLMGIFALLVKTALPAFKEISIKQFLFTAKWNPVAFDNDPKYGIGAMVLSTFMVTFGAMAIAVPLGIGTACYLSDIASPKIRELAKPIVEILAGIPSVVIGFLGIVLVGPVHSEDLPVAERVERSERLRAARGDVASNDYQLVRGCTEGRAKVVFGGIAGTRWHEVADDHPRQSAGGVVRHNSGVHAGNGAGDRRDDDGAHGDGKRPGAAGRFPALRSHAHGDDRHRAW